MRPQPIWNATRLSLVREVARSRLVGLSDPLSWPTEIFGIDYAGKAPVPSRRTLSKSNAARCEEAGGKEVAPARARPACPSEALGPASARAPAIYSRI